MSYKAKIQRKQKYVRVEIIINTLGGYFPTRDKIYILRLYNITILVFVYIQNRQGKNAIPINRSCVVVIKTSK